MTTTQANQMVQLNLDANLRATAAHNHRDPSQQFTIVSQSEGRLASGGHKRLELHLRDYHGTDWTGLYTGDGTGLAVVYQTR